MFTAVNRAKKVGLVLCLASAVAISGCASNGKQSADTEAAYYQAAKEDLEKANYSMAIERLSELQSRFPFGLYTKNSALDLMYAQYQSADYSSALIEADRFIRLNADHENIDYAWFIKSMSYYQLYLSNAGIFGTGDPAVRSPEQGQNAFSTLASFTSRFPDSDYRAEALTAMVILKDALARHELVVADYYIRRGAWVAAAERAQVVVQHYPGVSAVGDAWVVLIEAYDALELEADRSAALAQLQSQYPQHPTLESGEYQAPKWQEDRWWVKLFTLGLTS